MAARRQIMNPLTATVHKSSALHKHCLVEEDSNSFDDEDLMLVVGEVEWKELQCCAISFKGNQH